MFERARLTLTAWYLLIIMAISLVFSVVIFTEANRELTRFERIQRTRFEFEQSVPARPRPPMLNPEEIVEARMRLILTLSLINTGILGLSAFVGYFLAGRTLLPIKNMVDEQHRFVTDASHELRTPLTALRSEIEVALRGKEVERSTRKLLESNLEEVVALQALSNNLLELSKNGSFIDPKHMKEVSIKKITKTALKKLEGLIQAKQIVITNKTTDVKVLGIEDRLTEVLVILLDNAIKYSKEKGVVSVTSVAQKDHVFIHIQDKGIGIEKKDLPRIFDRFYRATSSRSGTAGYGLGLSIAKKTIESHEGNITVESEPNKKTTFTVSLKNSTHTS